MKTLVIATVGALLCVASGCASTLTVGPKANQSSYIGADASMKGASVTVPFVKASVSATEGGGKKK